MVHFGTKFLKDKKIILIDDERDILNLLETVLLKEGFKNIYLAEKGKDGLHLVEKVEPDMIVLDIMLPDIDGFEVCRQIREISLCPIIFLSAKTEDIDKLMGLGMGGDDYVTKPFSPKEIAYRIKAHFRRIENIQEISNNEQNAGEVIRFNDIEIIESLGEVKKQGTKIDLTAKEFHLLVYLAKRPNRILSKTQLLEQVWENDYEGYENTLMVHIRHLREKIEEDASSPKHILTYRGLGYKFVLGDDR